MPPGPDPDVLALGGLVVRNHRLIAREARLWLVDADDVRGVLRRLDPGLVPPTAAALEDRRWLHDFLTRLAATGFVAPRPLGVFDGASLTVHRGAIWELMTFIDGQAVGWDQEPGMEAIGSLLARYHDASSRIEMTRQRPAAIPIAEISTILAKAPARDSADPVLTQLRRWADQLDELLEHRGHTDRPVLVIHGDFTNHNVIANGTPPSPIGVIDFGLAHLECPLADLGFGLWRSGRPHQAATRIDPDRAGRLLHGYSLSRPLTERDKADVATFIFARGLQMATKRLRSGTSTSGLLAQLGWLEANRTRLSDTLVNTS